MTLSMNMCDSLETWSCFSWTTQICVCSFIASKGLELRSAQLDSLSSCLLCSHSWDDSVCHTRRGWSFLGHICGWHTVIHIIFYWPNMYTNFETKEIPQRHKWSKQSCTETVWNSGTIEREGREEKGERLWEGRTENLFSWESGF